MCLTYRKALYKGILAVIVDYDKIKNFMEIYGHMDAQSHPQIDMWAIRASIFEVLGCFGRTLIFYEFWDVQKVNQK